LFYANYVISARFPSPGGEGFWFGCGQLSIVAEFENSATPQFGIRHSAFGMKKAEGIRLLPNHSQGALWSGRQKIRKKA
jgi:hypothetical protein